MRVPIFVWQGFECIQDIVCLEHDALCFFQELASHVPQGPCILYEQDRFVSAAGPIYTYGLSRQCEMHNFRSSESENFLDASP
jgi:hypothetical protein